MAVIDSIVKYRLRQDTLQNYLRGLFPGGNVIVEVCHLVHPSSEMSGDLHREIFCPSSLTPALFGGAQDRGTTYSLVLPRKLTSACSKPILSGGRAAATDT